MTWPVIIVLPWTFFAEFSNAASSSQKLLKFMMFKTALCCYSFRGISVHTCYTCYTCYTC